MGGEDGKGSGGRREVLKLTVSVRKVAGALVNARSLQLECASLLHESLLVPVLMYGSETMLSKEKERSSIRAVEMGNLRDLMRIRRMDKVLNARIREGACRSNLYFRTDCCKNVAKTERCFRFCGSGEHV